MSLLNKAVREPALPMYGLLRWASLLRTLTTFPIKQLVYWQKVPEHSSYSNNYTYLTIRLLNIANKLTKLTWSVYIGLHFHPLRAHILG